MAVHKIRSEGVVFPFRYPDYPKEKAQYFLNKSVKLLSDI